MTIADIGEKALIQNLIRPLFNEKNVVEGVGDDCAMIEDRHGTVWLFSTDRVPADLNAFRLGILDYKGLGRYLAVLNISDIAACGGEPKGLLLNLGLPGDTLYEHLVDLCQGVQVIAERFNCPVLGGDLSSAAELSLSATSIGIAPSGTPLTRRGAKPGDRVFASRPVGLTPTAFAFYSKCPREMLSADEITLLNGQFTSLEPLVALGMTLRRSGRCSSCMDNTDGLGQSLSELATESSVAFVIDEEKLALDSLLERVAAQVEMMPIELAFGPGADFSLVGTLKGPTALTEEHGGEEVRVIGHVETGSGVWIEGKTGRERLAVRGWNYFSGSGQPQCIE